MSGDSTEERDQRLKTALLNLLDAGTAQGDPRVVALTRALGLAPWSESDALTVRAQLNVLRRLARGTLHLPPHLLTAARALAEPLNDNDNPTPVSFAQLRLDRQRLLDARINARVDELSELRPDHLADRDHAEANMQLKALGLASLQRDVRNAVLNEMYLALQPNPALAGDLRATSSWFRRSGVAPRRTTGIAESAGAGPRRDEKRHRQEQEERRRTRHRAYLKQLMTHKTEFTEAYTSRYSSRKKIAKEMSRLHTAKAREEERRKRKAETDRIKALRENDEEQYMKLLQETKNTRLLHLIQQTDDYLTQIGAQIGKQKESARDKPENEAKKRQSLEDDMSGNDDDPRAHPPKDGVLQGRQSDDETAHQNDHGPQLADHSAEQPPQEGELQGIKRRRDAYYTLTHTIKESVFQPKMLVGGKLKPYQFEGLSWLISLYNNNLNGILADEMGLGKTIQTIALLAYLYEVKENKGPFLVIVPLSTVSNWVRELELWVPDFITVVYKGDVATRKELQHTIVNQQRFNVLLTTYEYTVKDKTPLGKIPWKYIIIDEGHRMKNADSKLAITLASKYQSKNRVLLTGTPLQNNLTELWALLNFLLPSIFSSSDTFETWFSAPFQANALGDTAELSEEESLLVINRLHQVLRPFLLRRLKTDVEKQLPDKVEKVIKCGLSIWQKVLYRQVRNNVALGTGQNNQSKVFNNAVMQMKKICNHPYLFYFEDELVGLPQDMLIRSSGKFMLLRGMLEKLTATKHRTLVFSQMTKALDLLEFLLEGTAIQYLRLDGMTKADDRRDLLEKFSAPNSKYSCFLLSTRAGGLGLNLQTADTVIIFDSDWNPQQDLQAQDRAHRIGQTQEVRVFRLICSSTIEEHVLARANAKLQMDAQIIQAGKFNQKSSDNERQEYLKDLFKKKDGDEDDDVEREEDVVSGDELNRWLARTEEEEELFGKMDAENLVELSHDEADLPAWVLAPEQDDATLAEQNADIVLLGRGRRSKKSVVYNDNLTEREWTEMVDDGGDPNAANVEKKECLEARRRRPNPVIEGDTEEDSDAETTARRTRVKRKSVSAAFTGVESQDDSRGDEQGGYDSVDKPPKRSHTKKRRRR